MLLKRKWRKKIIPNVYTNQTMTCRNARIAVWKQQRLNSYETNVQGRVGRPMSVCYRQLFECLNATQNPILGYNVYHKALWHRLTLHAIVRLFDIHTSLIVLGYTNSTAFKLPWQFNIAAILEPTIIGCMLNAHLLTQRSLLNENQSTKCLISLCHTMSYGSRPIQPLTLLPKG